MSNYSHNIFNFGKVLANLQSLNKLVFSGIFKVFLRLESKLLEVFSKTLKFSGISRSMLEIWIFICVIANFTAFII